MVSELEPTRTLTTKRRESKHIYFVTIRKCYFKIQHGVNVGSLKENFKMREKTNKLLSVSWTTFRGNLIWAPAEETWLLVAFLWYVLSFSLFVPTLYSTRKMDQSKNSLWIKRKSRLSFRHNAPISHSLIPLPRRNTIKHWQREKIMMPDSPMNEDTSKQVNYGYKEGKMRCKKSRAVIGWEAKYTVTGPQSKRGPTQMVIHSLFLS